MNEKTGAGNAALALVEEEGELSLSNRHIDVSIVHDNVGGLATKLERDALQVVHVGVTHNLVTNFGAASEGNLVNIFVLSESFTSNGTITWNNVEDTVGEASLVEKLTDS